MRTRLPLLLAPFLLAPSLAAQQPLAVWKGGQVSEAQWNDLAAQATLENGIDARQVRGPRGQDLKYRVVRTWAEASIIADAATRAGITVPQADLDADWNEFVKGTGGPARAAARLQQAGISREKLMAQRRIFMLGKRYLDQAAPPQPVSEADTKTLYDRLRKEQPATFRIPERWTVSHIEFGTAPGMSPAEVALLRERAERARGAAAQPGADFAFIAKQYSTDLSTRDRGGLLPPLSREQLLKLPAPFGATAMSLKPGQVSAVIRTKSGFHILRGGERLPPAEVSYAEARPRLAEMIGGRRRMEVAQRKVDELLQAAGLEMKISPPPPPKSAASAPR